MAVYALYDKITAPLRTDILKLSVFYIAMLFVLSDHRESEYFGEITVSVIILCYQSAPDARNACNNLGNCRAIQSTVCSGCS